MSIASFPSSLTQLLSAISALFLFFLQILHSFIFQYLSRIKTMEIYTYRHKKDGIVATFIIKSIVIGTSHEPIFKPKHLYHYQSSTLKLKPTLLRSTLPHKKSRCFASTLSLFTFLNSTILRNIVLSLTPFFKVLILLNSTILRSRTQNITTLVLDKHKILLLLELIHQVDIFLLYQPSKVECHNKLQR